MTTDSELLRQYAYEGDDAAFTEVVRRHTNLVYSTALRHVRDTALAQDVTQTVFTKLAKAARQLCGGPTPIGWLHATTRHTAMNALRAEFRRHAREHEAYTMQSISSLPEANWEQLRPMLDEAVNKLRERDRQAVLLRFFDGLSHQEVGAMLGLTENSAQKCVDRALEKLRRYFARRGVTVSSTLLAAAMGANAVQAAPPGLAAQAAKTSLVGASGGASIGSTILFALFMSTKTKTTLAGVVLVLLASGGIWWTRRPKAAMLAKANASQATAENKLEVEAPKVGAVKSSGDAKPPAPRRDIPGAPIGQPEEMVSKLDEIAKRLNAGDVEGVLGDYFPDWTYRTEYPPGPGPTKDEWTQLVRKNQVRLAIIFQEMETATPRYERAPQGADVYYCTVLDPATGKEEPFNFYKNGPSWELSLNFLYRNVY